MRHLLFCLVCVASAASPALAQPAPNPILEHYRAYRSAFASGDFVAAEREAEAALAASEAQDGDGGRTAVLALNLAAVRLHAGDAENATAPAQRAMTLANAGAAGVDPTFAAIILGRAELAAGSEEGAARLRAIFAAPMTANVPAEELYPAASELGAWALRESDYATAELSWSFAGEYAEGAVGGEPFGLGTARAWQAASIFLDEIGSRGGRRMSQDRAHEAYRLAGEAVETLRPLSLTYSSDQGVTLAVRSFGGALAVRNIIRSKLLSDRQPVPGDVEAQGDVAGYVEMAGPVNLLTPPCSLRFRASNLRFPTEALSQGHIGAVAYLARIGEDGAITGEVIAAVGDDLFEQAVERADWRAERSEDALPNCRMPTSVVFPVSFAVRS